MQNYTIEHRAPKDGETYLFAEAGMVKTTVACEDHRIPQDVLVPVAPAWPDKHVIVIEKGEQPGARVAVLPVVAIRMTGAPFAGVYRDEVGGFWDPDEDTIMEWHEYVPVGYVPQEMVYEAAAQGAAAAAPEPRREYTADDLDDLPGGACAWDEYGGVWQRASDWFVAGASGAFTNPLRERFIQHLYSAPKN